jgi:hypothetical protein
MGKKIWQKTFDSLSLKWYRKMKQIIISLVLLLYIISFSSFFLSLVLGLIDLISITIFSLLISIVPILKFVSLHLHRVTIYIDGIEAPCSILLTDSGRLRISCGRKFVRWDEIRQIQWQTIYAHKHMTSPPELWIYLKQRPSIVCIIEIPIAKKIEEILKAYSSITISENIF